LISFKNTLISNNILCLPQLSLPEVVVVDLALQGVEAEEVGLVDVVEGEAALVVAAAVVEVVEEDLVTEVEEAVAEEVAEAVGVVAEEDEVE